MDFFFQAEDGIRDADVTGVQTCALPICDPTSHCTNDEGWETVFVEWLVGSRLGPRDGLLVFSVGGGNREKNVSANLVRAIDRAREVGAKVFGIVGRDGGHTARAASASVVIPPLFADRITPHTEGLCAVIWHLLVSHPRLQRKGTKWESIVRP